MGRRRVLFSLVGAMVLVLCLPAAALAGTFTWDQPADFTAAAPGANPDHDKYGGQPWRYEESPSCLAVCLPGQPSHNSSTFTLLDSFNAASATWTNSGVAVGLDNPNSRSNLLVTAPADRLAVVGWTNLLDRSATVSISATIAAATTPCFTWTVDQGSVALPGLSGTTTGSFSGSASVLPGGSIYFTLQQTSIGAAGCNTAEVTLHLATAGLAPTVTLDTPGNNSALTNGQPTFSGTAASGYGVQNAVTVHVYSGTGTSTEVQPPLQTTVSGGHYAVAPAGQLPNGTYTAVAQQANDVGDVGSSSPPVTFTLNNTGPHISLNNPGSAPLTTATPTLAGSASTAPGDAQTVNVAVYAGSAPTSTPLRYLSATVGSDGGFSVPVSPALPDGDYAAVAAQRGANTTGFSNVVTFRIKVHAPALTLTYPTPGANVPTPRPTFTGAAGANPGDAGTVSVTIHAGSTASGRTVGRGTAPVSGGRWTLRSPVRLGLGIYALVIAQRDDAGHTTTVITTFVVVPAPRVIGARVTLSGTRVALPIACTAGSGTTCRGTVLVLTTRRLQTRAGGPVGPVRLLFAYVGIAGGHTQTVRASLPAYVAGALRRVHHLQVRVTVSLSGQSRSTALRTVS